MHQSHFLTQIIKGANFENNAFQISNCAFIFAFPIFIYVFLLQSTFNCQSFQYLSRTWEKVKEQFSVPNPQRKQCIQLMLIEPTAK